MYVCMDVCMYACMYVRMYVRMYLCTHVRMYIRTLYVSCLQAQDEAAHLRQYARVHKYSTILYDAIILL